MLNIIISIIKLIVVLAIVIFCTKCIVEYIMGRVMKQFERREKEIRMLRRPHEDRLVTAEIENWVKIYVENDEVLDKYLKIKIDGIEYVSHSNRMLHYVRKHGIEGKCVMRYTRWRKRASLFENLDLTISYVDKYGNFDVIHHE